MKHGGIIGLIIAIAGFATVIVLGVIVALGFQTQSQPFQAAADTASPTSQPLATTQDTSNTGPSRPAPPPVAGQPLTLSVPAVGLTTRIGSMRRPGSGTIDPPTSSIAYWISSYGTAGPASTNTVYIAGHTCRGKCHAVFSAFLNIPTSSTLVNKGDKVLVGTPEATYTYTVTDTALYEKTTLENQTELWKIIPGRLVLVTCFQYLGGTSSQQNFVVYAQLDPGQS
jgi:hypothetical protein